MLGAVERRTRHKAMSCAIALGLAAVPAALVAQTSAPTQPPADTLSASPTVQAALKQADAGDPAPLTALADAGDTDAQYFAAVMYVLGRGAIAKDPAKGCAYAQKASGKRGDAMHLLGTCYQSGAGGTQDKSKAEAAYSRAAAMGYSKAKCALGQMLMTDPAQAERGRALCEAAATAGDAEAQAAVGNAYFAGAGVKGDRAAARKWYERASQQGDLDASRRLGEMYANGVGGPKDTKKAMALWTAGEKAGDPLVSILVADQMFAELTGGKKPGPGTYAFRGGVPTDDLKVVQEWYQQALDRDPRPDVKDRAKYALAILRGIETGVQSSRPPKRK